MTLIAVAGIAAAGCVVGGVLFFVARIRDTRHLLRTVVVDDDRYGLDSLCPDEPGFLRPLLCDEALEDT